MFAYRLGEFCSRALYEFLAEIPAHFYTICLLIASLPPPLALFAYRFAVLLACLMISLAICVGGAGLEGGGAGVGGVVYCYFDQSNTVVNSNEMQVGALFDWIFRHGQWAWLNFKLGGFSIENFFRCQCIL